MKSIKDMFSSAVSELVLDDSSKKAEPQAGKKETPPAEKSEPGSLSDFDRIMGMLESGSKQTRDKAFSELGSLASERLACVAVFSKNSEAREAALERISANTDLICAVFAETRYKDTSDKALEMLVSGEHTPRSNALIASSHPSRERRMRALKEIKDANALLEVAYGSRFEDARWEAISALKYMKIDIGLDDLRHDDTLMGLADQLVKSSATEEDVIADMEIILENVEFLQEMKGSGEFAGVIADNLSSYKRVLRSTATSSKHPKARTLAVKGVSPDIDMLSEIAQHSEYEDSSRLAVERIGSSLAQAGPMALALVASMSKEGELRTRALSKLKDAEMLKHVCKFSEYEDSRFLAATKMGGMVERIDDIESLRLILVYAKDAKGRAAAEKRMASLSGKEVRAEPQVLRKIEEPGESAKAVEPERTEPQRTPEPQRSGKSLIDTIKELIGI